MRERATETRRWKDGREVAGVSVEREEVSKVAWMLGQSADRTYSRQRSDVGQWACIDIMGTGRQVGTRAPVQENER